MMAGESLKTVIIRGLEGVLAWAKQMPDEGPQSAPGRAAASYTAQRPNWCSGALTWRPGGEDGMVKHRTKCRERVWGTTGLCADCTHLERQDREAARERAMAKAGTTKASAKRGRYEAAQ